MTPEKQNVDFIGIGAQKAATTWLFQCLREHPNICMARQKEIHFFSNPELFMKGEEWYQSHFKDCSTPRLVGEVSASYLSSPASPERMYRYNPGLKIIVVLRDPVERSISHINHLVSKLRITGKESVEDIVKEYPEIIENGLYGTHLSRYFSLFSREQVLVLFYEDIGKDSTEFLKKVFQFLGVDDSYVSSNTSSRYNSSSFRLSPWFRVLNKLYFKMRKHSAGKFLLKTGKRLGVTANNLEQMFDRISRKNNLLSEGDRKELKQYFLEDIEKLEQLINRDLSHWK